MAATTILGPKSTSHISDPFMVTPGKVIVISSFNFACAETNDVGDVTKEADCAILHKVNMGYQDVPVINSCTKCANGVLQNLGPVIKDSEPVVQCGTTWTHTHETNLSVLSVPGVYVFELCSPDSVGVATIQIEELEADQAALLPKELYHGAC